MKNLKSISGILLVGLLSINSAFPALADVLPEGKKYVESCAIMAGDFPKIALVAVETGPTLSEPNVYEYKPEGDVCLDVGYKFNTLTIYALDVQNYKGKKSVAGYDVTKDPYAYKTSIPLDVSDKLVEMNDPTQYLHREYLIHGVDNQKKQLVIALAAEVTDLMVADYRNAPPAGLDDHIIIPQESASFTDVPLNSPYYNAVQYLKTAGIVGGYPDGSFKPNNLINRAEFTKIIVGATRRQPDNGLCLETFAQADGSYTDMFTDISSSSGAQGPVWYLNDLCYAKVEKLISGYPDGSFKPANNINFVEAAKIIDNGFQLYGDGAASPWYAVYVNILAYHKAIPQTINRFDQHITRGEMAEMIYRLKAEKTDLPSKTYSELK